MPSDVKVPLLGNVPKPVLIIGGISAVGVVGYIILRRSKQAVTGAAGYGAAAGYGYGATAYGYGVANDYYGYGAYGYGGGGAGIVPAPTGSEYGYGAYGYGYYNPYTGQYLGGGTGSGVVTPVPTPTAPTTNLQWVNQASSAIGGHRAALLRYIGGISLAQGQEKWIQEAIGTSGNPPVAGKSGYPPKWRGGSTGSGSQGGNSHTITANGTDKLWQIAIKGHITEKKLVGLNPNLRSLEGSHKPVPRGTRVKV
jgi:hypothetical protein